MIEARFHRGQPDRPPALAAQLVALRVDIIIFCANTGSVRAVRDVTGTMPIVIDVARDAFVVSPGASRSSG